MKGEHIDLITKCRCCHPLCQRLELWKPLVILVITKLYARICFLIHLFIKTIWQTHQSSFVCAMTGRCVEFLVAVTCVRVVLYGLWKCFHFVRLSGWLLLVGGVYHYFSYKCFLSYFFHVTHFQFVLWSARAFKFSYFLIKKLFSLTCL